MLQQLRRKADLHEQIIFNRNYIDATFQPNPMNINSVNIYFNL